MDAVQPARQPSSQPAIPWYIQEDFNIACRPCFLNKAEITLNFFFDRTNLSIYYVKAVSCFIFKNFFFWILNYFLKFSWNCVCTLSYHATLLPPWELFLILKAMKMYLLLKEVKYCCQDSFVDVENVGRSWDEQDIRFPCKS